MSRAINSMVCHQRRVRGGRPWEVASRTGANNSAINEMPASTARMVIAARYLPVRHHHHLLRLQNRHQKMFLLGSPSIALPFLDSRGRSVSTSAFGIAPQSLRGEHFASTQPQRRMFTNSCTRLNRPSSSGGNGRGEGNAKQSDGRENSTEQEPSGAAALNQRATNAILSQLSSPPNVLTLSRILATPYLSYLIISHRGESSDGAGLNATTETAAVADTLSTVDPSSTPVIALSLFLVMGFTDFLDGYIARKFPSTATVLGTYLDPFADKFFISVVSLTLWYSDILPGALVGLWVARDVTIVGSVYWLVKQETIRKRSSEDEGIESSDENNNIAVMDPKNTPLKVQASMLSKVNTTFQIGLIALGIAGEVPQIDIPPELMTGLIWLTAGTTIGSSIGYLDGSALMKSGNKRL